jgi:arginase family enzyme
VDVFNPAVMPAVDSPEFGGPLADELVARLSPIVHHPQALGLDVTVYDPALDPRDQSKPRYAARGAGMQQTARWPASRRRCTSGTPAGTTAV